LKANDILCAGASLALITIIAVLVLAAVLFLFTAGSPLLLMGVMVGLGIWGIILLFGLLMAFIGVWYALYSLIKGCMEPGSKGEEGEYRLDRVKRA
jgi:hypothetical protein